MSVEDRYIGSVPLSTYLKYIQLNGGVIFVIVILLFVTISTVLQILSNFQLVKWTESPLEGNKNLVIYSLLSLGAGLSAFIRTATLITAGIIQGRTLHKDMVKHLLYSPMKWWNSVPLGRILNRISKDLRQLDQIIGFAVGYILTVSFAFVGSVAICVISSSLYVLIPIAIFILACGLIRFYYMKTQRQCVRLQAITRSPLVSHLAAVVDGLSTVRSYKFQNRFIDGQIQHIDNNNRAQIARKVMEIWFSMRLTILSFMVNITAISFAIFSKDVTPAFAGLLLNYALTIDDQILQLVIASTNLQNRMISVQRCLSFSSLPCQQGYINYLENSFNKQQQINNEFITNGQIKFLNYKVKYREQLDYVLKGINIDIKGGQKIGIVGRTGAGKSTITQCILRIIQPTEGAILIDNKDISQLCLKDLRSGITIIPQQPILFQSNIRENIDPLHQFNDQRLLQVLEDCCLNKVIQKDGLNTMLSENGDNLSVGQKQLISIVRAILKQSKIVLIDQATANIDVHTQVNQNNQGIIQSAIKRSLKECTVLTIAHRINTILDSDRILVLKNGNVQQFDSPDILLKRGGLFANLYKQSLTQKN